MLCCFCSYLIANWNAVSGQKCIIPFGAGAGKVFKLGQQPTTINAQIYNNVVRPDGWGDWQARLQIQLLFPMCLQVEQQMPYHYLIKIYVYPFKTN